MPVSTPTLLLPGMDGTGRLFAPLLAELPTTIAEAIARFIADLPTCA